QRSLKVFFEVDKATLVPQITDPGDKFEKFLTHLSPNFPLQKSIQIQASTAAVDITDLPPFLIKTKWPQAAEGYSKTSMRLSVASPLDADPLYALKPLARRLL